MIQATWNFHSDAIVHDELGLCSSVDFFPNDFWSIHELAVLLWYPFVTSWRRRGLWLIVDVDNGCCECKIYFLVMVVIWCMEFSPSFIRVLFRRYLGHFIFHVIESMMTSSNGNIFRVTGHLCGEFTGPRWIPRTKASDAELWCLLWSAPE